MGTTAKHRTQGNLRGVLTALEHGVRGGRWFPLIDKVYALPTLRAAFARVKANHGRQVWIR